MSCKTRLHSALPWTWRLTVEGGRWDDNKGGGAGPANWQFLDTQLNAAMRGQIKTGWQLVHNQTRQVIIAQTSKLKNSRYNNFKTKNTIVCLLYHNTRHRRMGILITNQHVLWNDIMWENICWGYKSLLVMGFLIKNQCALESNRVGKYLPF